MAKRKDILADFTKSLADKPTPTPAPAPVSEPAPAPPPVPQAVSAPAAAASRSLPPPRPLAAEVAAPAAVSRQEVEPEVPVKGLGYQKITISLTQADLDLIKSVRLAIAQKGGDLLNTSQLLKVALREMNAESETLLGTIAVVKSMDLRRTK
jgi:hypothetical protein